MPTKVIKIAEEDVDTEKLKEAAVVVDSGGLAAFPTETVYGIACRVRTETLRKLDTIKGRSNEKYYTLHIGHKGELGKYVPTLGLRAQKVVKNAWPGPLTIVFELTEADMTKQKERLEKEVFENLYRDNTIGIRCPDSAIASGLLGLVNHPAVAPSANITGRAAAISAEEVLEQFGDGLELLLDGGTCKYKQNSTVAKIGKNGVEILRAGAYPKEKLEETAQVKFLLVCTGNTCRSPMAHGFFSKYLAEKSGCGVDRLEQKGYKVFSAGTMGLVGSQATSEAIAACRAKGIEIAEHRSTALSKELLDDCDIIYVMGRMHREYVVSMSPEAAEKCMLLADDVEIPDPIGQPQATYNSCAEMIEKAVKKRIGELEI